MANDGIAERDEKGRIVRRAGATPGAGRPRLEAQERMRQAIAELADDETLAAWQAAMRRKLAKGNGHASVFVRDSLLGKPAVTVHGDASPELQQFMAAWAAAKADKDTA